MVKLREKNKPRLAILFAMVGFGVGMIGTVGLEASPFDDWNNASISSTVDSGIAQIVSTTNARQILDGILLSSTLFNAGGWIEVRDSATANTSLIGNGQSGAVLTVFSSGTIASTSVSQDHAFYFPRGVRFYKGMSFNASGCSATVTVPCFTVLYRQIGD